MNSATATELEKVQQSHSQVPHLSGSLQLDFYISLVVTVIIYFTEVRFL